MSDLFPLEMYTLPFMILLSKRKVKEKWKFVGVLQKSAQLFKASLA